MKCCLIRLIDWKVIKNKHDIFLCGTGWLWALAFISEMCSSVIAVIGTMVVYRILFGGMHAIGN